MKKIFIAVLFLCLLIPSISFADAKASADGTVVPAGTDLILGIQGGVNKNFTPDGILSILGLIKGTYTNGYLCTYTTVGTLHDCNTNPASFLASTVLDDTKGNGDTAFVWSADKVYDQLALKQAADADLTTWAGITPSANLQTFLGTPNAANFETAIGAGAFASDLLGYANAAAVLSGIGAQASDADLTAIAALSCTENQIIKRNGAGAWVCAADNDSAGTPTAITVADTTDTTSYVGLFESATGDLGPKTDGGITYNAGTGVLTATGFAGPLTGDVTGNVSGTAASLSGSALPANSTVSTSLAIGADPADAGAIRLSNAGNIAWEASAAGTDVVGMSVDTAEVVQIGASGASGVTITPNTIITGTLTVNGSGGITVAKQSGVAGDMSVYEANSTDTHAAGFRGPASITGDGAYRILFPNARASSANMCLVVTNAAESGTGTAADPYIQTGSWIDLDDYAVVNSPTFTDDITIHATGVKVTGDGDGAITFLGLGDGSDEDLTLNFDDVSNEVGVSSSTGVTKINMGSIGLASTGSFQGAVAINSDANGMSSSEMTAVGLYNTMFFATGAGTWALPTAAAGMNFCVYSTTAAAIVINPDDSDDITLNGTLLADGDSITSASGAGDFICLIAIDATHWYTMGRSGTWTDTN